MIGGLHRRSFVIAEDHKHVMEMPDEFLAYVHRAIVGIEVVAPVREAQSPLVHEDRVLAADLVVLSHAKGEER